jgi:hypothetical protein
MTSFRRVVPYVLLGVAMALVANGCATETPVQPGAMARPPGGPTLGVVSTFTVTNTADAGAGSLRQAILDANANPGLDYVGFAIATASPGCNAASGVCTIQPASPLPTITDALVIDGYTQPGATANSNPPGQGSNAALKIELDGTNVSPNQIGLTITGGGSTVRGLVINRFALEAVRLDGSSGGNVIEGNFIGTNVAGTTALPNNTGIVVFNPGNTIGGNVIVAGGTGVELDGPNAGNNVVQGNLIGTDAAGTVALGGSALGVRLEEGAHDNTVGGTAAGAGNVISGHGVRGIDLDGSIGTDPVTGNVVAGNLIGTDVTGAIALGNGTGIRIYAAAGNRIGSAMSGGRNVISASVGAGIEVQNAAAENVIAGNFIGTDGSGTSPLGNAGDGVFIAGSANNVIGGTAAGAGNTIAFNGGAGVFVISGSGNAIRSNSIFTNTGLGIDLGVGGTTFNDAGDVDAGANELQNFPVLASVTTNGASTTVSGALNSMANATFAIDFYANDLIDPSGYGEGQIFLGTTNVTTDAAGNADFTAVVAAGAAAGQQVTATATAAAGNTSEFSQSAEVVLTTISVAIDIKPGDGPNTINPRANGTIPVAILSTAEFDAATAVDRSSLTFGRIGDEPSLVSCDQATEDVNGDAWPDLVCHFDTQQTGFIIGDTEGILQGSTLGGVSIEGRDAVRVIGM